MNFFLLNNFIYKSNCPGSSVGRASDENRCRWFNSPGHHVFMRKILFLMINLSFVFILVGCKKEKNFFPHQQGLIWNYEIKINSDYTGLTKIKRLTTTNIASNNMGKGIIFSKIYSNGNMLSFFKDKFEDNLIRTAAKVVSKSGYDEPVEKIIYPSLGFKIDNWKTKSQLYNKGFNHL